MFPPVAQPDNAADSDSEERGFESLRAGFFCTHTVFLGMRFLSFLSVTMICNYFFEKSEYSHKIQELFHQNHRIITNILLLFFDLFGIIGNVRW